MNKIYKLMDWLEEYLKEIKHESNLSTDDSEILEYDGAEYAVKEVIRKIKEIYSDNF